MTNLMQYVDVCIGNEEDAEKVLGFKPALKHTIPSDFNIVMRAEVEALVGGDASRRVQR
jgi:sugar/nucleoside kinase (ribokinase family)